MKPLRKKLQKCRDSDRADLVELQRARREQANTKPTTLQKSTSHDLVLGKVDRTRSKRQKTAGAADDVFGPSLG
ncbi:hypothetical protein E4U40_007223 [Claviceps sp. LM458 group G5]|nr:hypothetical protein E4U40_007223 [Claviceps sp. LM458 group G5]